MRTNPNENTTSPLLIAIAVISLLFGCGLIVLIAVAVVGPEVRSARPTAAAVAVEVSPAAATHTSVPTIAAVVPLLPSSTPFPTETITPSPTITPTPTDSPASPTPGATATATDAPAAVAAAPERNEPRCVSVAGDSVAHGDAVFEIPATGYVTVRMAPVGTFIEAQYRQRGFSNVQVFNRTSPAVGISASNHPSYFGTPEYNQLLADGCDYTVIIPWINDLTGGNPTDHVNALTRLVNDVLGSDAGGRILLLNYYQGAPAPFARDTFASGFTPDQVNAFNAAIGGACSRGGLSNPRVNCIDVNSAFVGVGSGHVVGQMNRADFESRLIAPLSPDEGGMVNLFFDQNPTGLLLGDGVHLSSTGKRILASYLVDRMQ